MYKAVKVLNLFSVLLFAGILLLVYAFLPISVNLNIDFFSNIHKHQFFYYAVTIFILSNLVLRVVLQYGLKGIAEQLSGWMFLLIFVVNLYLTLLTGYIGVLNNPSSIEASSYGYLTYLGPLVVFVWIVGLLYLLFVKKQN